jgi:hypothetical protein
MDNNNIPKSSWFSRFMSVDEEKTSALVASFIVFSALAVYCVLTKGDIPPALTTVLTLEAGVIGGVNAVSFVANNLAMNKTQNGMMPMQNQYGSSNSYSPYGNSSMGMSGMGMNSMPIIPNSTVTPIGQVTQQTTTTNSSMPKPY